MTRVEDRDGDVWDVHLVWVDHAFRWPAFKRRSRHLASQPAPYGVGEPYYRMFILPNVIYWFVIAVYPFLAAVALATYLLYAGGQVVGRVTGLRPWLVRAAPIERPNKSLTYAVRGHLLRAAKTTSLIRTAIERDEGRYEIEGADLVGDPLYQRVRKND